jgi:alkylation response protein AidB-like acyl-CoA dehydrogenase
VGKEEKKLGIHATACTELSFTDCVVPASNRIGNEGEGYKIALSTLDGGRIGIAAQAVGIAQAALDAAVAFAGERETFGRKVGEHGQVQGMLAEMSTSVAAARALLYEAAAARDAGDPVTLVGAQAKLFASQVARRVTGDAIQVMGGYGYTREFPAERYYRDAKITEIYEGTSEIQRLVIARQLLGRARTPVAAG